MSGVDKYNNLWKYIEISLVIFLILLKIYYISRLCITSSRQVAKKRRFFMKCPYCNVENTRVIDSRPADDGNTIRRRRQCDACMKRFTTYEKVEAIPMVVIKKDMNREPYDRSKIESGVFRSCHKRPISVDQINAFVDEIENKIFAMDQKEIDSSIIGEMIMDKLKDLDAVAYVRFASVYREFKDVNTFMEELKKILE